jgi:hypothetical protein
MVHCANPRSLIQFGDHHDMLLIALGHLAVRCFFNSPVRQGLHSKDTIQLAFITPSSLLMILLTVHAHLFFVTVIVIHAQIFHYSPVNGFPSSSTVSLLQARLEAWPWLGPAL